jgi:hypothetical protein
MPVQTDASGHGIKTGQFAFYAGGHIQSSTAPSVRWLALPNTPDGAPWAAMESQINLCYVIFMVDGKNPRTMDIPRLLE